MLCIPQSSSITGTSSSDSLVSYPGLLLWAGGLTPLQRCSWGILQPQLTGHSSLKVYQEIRLGNTGAIVHFCKLFYNSQGWGYKSCLIVISWILSKNILMYKECSKTSKPHTDFPICHTTLTCTEIKTEIWISFSSFIKSGSMLSNQKCSSATFLSGWGLELFEWLLYNVQSLLRWPSMLTKRCFCLCKNMLFHH